MKKLLSALLAMALIVSMVQGYALVAEDSTQKADKEDYFFNILEISPKQDDFVLKQSDFDSSEVKLYQYTIREYNAVREDLVGLYDVVYLGNGTSNEEAYYTLGEKVNKLPAGEIKNDKLVKNYDSETKVFEYMPGNDATELVLGYFDQVRNAGQIVIADKKLKDFSDKDARIHAYVDDNEDELMLVKQEDVKSTIKGLMNYDSYKGEGTPRPYLELTKTPSIYDGTEDSYIDTSSGTILNFTYKVLGYEDDAKFDVRFYFDVNGDNKFYSSDGELLKKRTNVSANTDLNFSLVIPEDFRGLQQFKFEVEDLSSGAMNYKSGYMAFSGDTALEMNVLQVACNGNTFNLETDLVDEAGNNLLNSFDKDYDINVDLITMSELWKLYDDTDFKLTEYIGPGNTKTYNMIIFGFADVYGGADIKNQAMADDLKDFINTGQSVMFTHDNLTFRVDSSGGWSREFTRYFRDFVGQNMYSDGDYPKNDRITLGFSDMAFERANGQGFKTTQTVYAFNDGIMTNYPYSLIKGGVDNLYDMSYNDRLLKVATTHYQYYQLDLNNEEVVVWYTLTGDSRLDYRDPANYYYTYNIGSVTYSGTGHTDLEKAKSYEERKLFVNTIIKAIRGANFAPELEIQGVSDGDKVGRSSVKMELSVLATDPDINDQYLGGEVYLDKNGDGNFAADELVESYDINDYSYGANSAIVNAVPRDVILDLNLLDEDLSEFSFKVVVNDLKGATATKIYTFEIVDSPSLRIDLNAPNGMLLGDKTTIVTRAMLNVPDKSIEKRIYDINLTTAFYTSSDKTEQVSLTDNSKLSISNKSAAYSLTSNVLKDQLTSIVDPWPGTIDYEYDRWSFDLQPKAVGTYYLDAGLSYKLETYGFGESKGNGQSIKVSRGQIQYDLKDDFGASINEAIAGKIYYYDSLADVGDVNDPNLAKGTKVADVSITNSSLVYGDDNDELMETGYYVLLTEGLDGYGSAKSVATYVDYVNPNHVVDIVVQAQPISGFKWTHKDHEDSPGMLKPMESTEIATSEIRFDTFRSFESFEFSYDDSEAKTRMDMTYVGASLDGADVTSKFTYDAVNGTMTWDESEGEMPTGEYVFTFRHSFKAATFSGVEALYMLDPDVSISAPNADGDLENRTYSFPEVLVEPLRFFKLVDIL